MNDQNNPSCYKVHPIGFLDSPFKEKFGLPRQADLIQSANAYVVMTPDFSDPLQFEALASFSHIWLTFIFHQSIENGWKNRVRPPRLGGNKKVGVFASRSPFRPNFIGQSAVTLRRIIHEEGTIKLEISCPDIVSGTPIIDIKPYLSYADSREADSSYAQEIPKESLGIEFSISARNALEKYSSYPKLAALISEVLSLDPRPAYHEALAPREYGLRLYDFNIKFEVKEGIATVTDILAT